MSDYLSAETRLASKLTSVKLGNLLAVLLLDSLLLLGEDDLNVARVREVRVDTTVSTVGSAALLGGLVDNNVGNVEVLNGKTLSLCTTVTENLVPFLKLKTKQNDNTNLGVALSVLQQVNNEFGRLDGPASLCGLEGLGLSSAANTTVETTERNGLLVLLDITEVGKSLGELQASDGSGNLTGVLELDILNRENER
jgi:hypothetical protein